MKALKLLAVVAVAWLATGCLEVDLEIEAFYTGEVLLSHTVAIPTAVLNMRLGALGMSPNDARTEMMRMMEQDAALVGQVDVVDAAVRQAADKTLLVRRLLFTDGSRVTRYLDLLGLTASYERAKKTGRLEIEAEALDIRKLARLGRFVPAEDGAMAAEPGAPSGDALTIRALLPGTTTVLEPAGRRAGRGARLRVADEGLDQPIRLVYETRLPKPKAPRLGAPQPFPGEALDNLLRVAGDAESKTFTRRLGGRMVPILHARLDRRTADLAVLWSTDDTSRAAVDYQRRVDGAVVPELGLDYFDWLEVLKLDDRRVVAEGFRTLAPRKFQQLRGPLTVDREGEQYVVRLTPAQLYREQDEAPDRVVAVLVVTFPSGEQAHAAVTVADLQAGRGVELRGE